MLIEIDRVMHELISREPLPSELDAFYRGAALGIGRIIETYPRQLSEAYRANGFRMGEGILYCASMSPREAGGLLVPKTRRHDERIAVFLGPVLLDDCGVMAPVAGSVGLWIGDAAL